MKVKYFDRNYLINLDIFMREEDKIKSGSDIFGKTKVLCCEKGKI